MPVLGNTTSFQWQPLTLSLSYHAKRLTLGDFSLRDMTFNGSAQASSSVTVIKVLISTAKNIQVPNHGAPGHRASQMLRCPSCHPEHSMAVKRFFHVDHWEAPWLGRAYSPGQWIRILVLTHSKPSNQEMEKFLGNSSRWVFSRGSKSHAVQANTWQNTF